MPYKLEVLVSVMVLVVVMELDIRDPIDEGIAEIIKSCKNGGERMSCR